MTSSILDYFVFLFSSYCQIYFHYLLLYISYIWINCVLHKMTNNGLYTIKPNQTKQTWSGIELRSPCPFSVMVTISPYVVYNTYTYQIHRRILSFQTQMSLLTSDFSPWRHKERDTILKSLCWPHHNVRCILWCLRSENPTTSFNGQNPTLVFYGQNPTLVFSKSSNSQDHLFWAWRHPHSSSISSLGVYYDKRWLSYPLHASVNLHLMTMHLNS